jgi:carboxyl-terminal processing protease
MCVVKNKMILKKINKRQSQRAVGDHSVSITKNISRALFTVMWLMLATITGCKSESKSRIVAGGNGGGTGGGTSGLIWTPNQYAPYEDYYDQCAAPRSGIDPSTGKPYYDRPGSAAHEKFALRSYSHEMYLWANELTDIDPTTSLNPLEYFEYLKTRTDRFHFYQKSSDYYQDFILGKSLSYGITWEQLSNGDIVVVYVERNSPAQLAGVVRGDRLVKVDGVSAATLIQTNNKQFNEALFPSEGTATTHQFVFKNHAGVEQPQQRLTAVELTVDTVQNLQFFTGTHEQKIAYFSFSSFNGTAENELVDVVKQIKTAQAQELIIDLRYNGGGFLDVASELAYMVAGDGPTNNRIFTAFRVGPNNTDERFLNRTTEFYNQTKAEQPLPALNLKRLYVLTGGGTCSASESLINGLRGVDFPVIQIGEPTCGKPYGFFGFSNCGYEYFTISFQGANAKGFSRFEDGFAPNNSEQAQGSPLGCTLYDSLAKPLGDTQEALLAAAVQHIETGTCPSGGSLAAPRGVKNTLLHSSPLFSNSIAPRGK